MVSKIDTIKLYLALFFKSQISKKSLKRFDIRLKEIVLSYIKSFLDKKF